jgi:hypothetical protein
MPAETPHNVGYLVAAYVVAPVILAGYLAALWGRVRKVDGREDAQTEGRKGGRTERRKDGRVDGLEGQ